MNGNSSLRKVQLETGQVLQHIELDGQYFGEGITIVGDQIVQLTYKTEIGFVYGLADFSLRRRFSYKGEGWALTHDARQIYMSDGTAEVRVLDPATLMEKRRITVRDGGMPVQNVNELEYINGEIFANVWMTERIVRFSPQTGGVTGWIDLSGILSPLYRSGRVDVLNGIAYDAARKRIFVTGKYWPSVFEIQVIPKPAK